MVLGGKDSVPPAVVCLLDGAWSSVSMGKDDIMSALYPSQLALNAIISLRLCSSLVASLLWL